MDGLIPHVDFTLPQDEIEAVIEEQRRLFYVAITRSRQTLVLSSVFYLPLNEGFKMRASVKRIGHPTLGQTIASPFFRELGPACPNAVTGEDFLKAVIRTLV